MSKYAPICIKMNYVLLGILSLIFLSISSAGAADNYIVLGTIIMASVPGCAVVAFKTGRLGWIVATFVAGAVYIVCALGNLGNMLILAFTAANVFTLIVLFSACGEKYSKKGWYERSKSW